MVAGPSKGGRDGRYSKFTVGNGYFPRVLIYYHSEFTGFFRPVFEKSVLAFDINNNMMNYIPRVT